MITHPRAAELAQAVAGWIDQVRPGLDPRNAFLARVAANALAVIARELDQGPAAEAAAAERLRGLLGGEGDLAALTEDLCGRLQRGEMNAATPGLLAALRANTLDQLGIDQPGYRHEGLDAPPQGELARRA